MKNHIQNKTVLITGATSGIGRQLATDLISYNVNLILIARSTDKLEELQATLAATTSNTISTYTLDVRDRSEVHDTMTTILAKHTVDILINNAGLASGLSKLHEGDLDQWDNMLDTNVKGLLYISKPIIAKMIDLPTAHVINIGSVAGKTAYSMGNVYCATKAAVHMLTENMNIDLLATNVKVSTIAPGAVNTNFANVRFNDDKSKVDAVYEGYTPLGADDVSSAIINVLNTPPHVNIQHLDIMPTAQRNPYTLDRSGTS